KDGVVEFGQLRGRRVISVLPQDA
ncbi:MAG: hypothetical protein JWN62_2987, partial [Acidimicrobiales bacterium]|nr:hypothetical protein [Acidimicrobiales bacterium]